MLKLFEPSRGGASASGYRAKGGYRGAAVNEAQNQEPELLIIGAGVGRTGTKSLKDALEILGFPCHHMYEVIRGGLTEVEKWSTVLRAKRRQILEQREDLDVSPAVWKDLLSGYTAAVDFPACIFYRDLKKLYPRAKVILTVRSRESWYASVRETIGATFTVPRYSFASTVWRWVDPFARAFATEIDGEIFLTWKLLEKSVDDPYKGMRDAELMMQCYEEHIRDVQRSINREDLLVMNVNEGWGPLCRFLQVEEPSEPFPRSNDKEEFIKRREKLFFYAVLIVAVPTVLCVLLFILLYRFTMSDIPRRKVI
mmetsp:Transcript_3192/g.9732  ORF Transcript_3192/g.9732 Transcript_3192/m.9732 type:complete len:311 (-) Transcript_3192:477-1409(-)